MWSLASASPTPSSMMWGRWISRRTQELAVAVAAPGPAAGPSRPVDDVGLSELLAGELGQAADGIALVDA